MILYRVLAAHKLWELLRSDKDGLVDESKTTSNENKDDGALPTVNNSAQNPSTIPTDEKSTVLSSTELAIDLNDEALDGDASTLSTTNYTLGVPPTHQNVASASGDVSIDIHDPNFPKPETSVAEAAAEKASAWWQKLVNYLKRPGYKGAGRRVFWQILDLELFHILYVNIIVGMTGSSAPQRMLKVYEAVFEAAPQVWALNLFPFPFRC